MSTPELHTGLERTATQRPQTWHHQQARRRTRGALRPHRGGTYGGGRRKKNGEPCEPTSCGTSVHRVASAPRPSRASASGDECYTRVRMSHDDTPDGSSDPWSSIEPIGHREDPAASDQSDQVDAPTPPLHGLTQHEYQRRTARTKNARDAAAPLPETATATPRKSVKLRPTLTVREILGMNERMMKRFYKRATDDSARAADQKFAAVGFGVTIDKFTVLSTRSQERPSTVSEREGLRALAVRLLTERQSGDAGDVEDGCRESAG